MGSISIAPEHNFIAQLAGKTEGTGRRIGTNAYVLGKCRLVQSTNEQQTGDELFHNG